MKPREIEVHIEELVLHGFPPNERWRIGDALESELRRLLTAEGLPQNWRGSLTSLDAGKISLTSQAAVGREVAAAVYRGGESKK